MIALSDMRYKDLLQRPEWKQRRSEIIRRDKICQSCDTDSNLEVHHVFYIKDRLPWEYPEDLLLTLCRDCHQKETNYSFLIDHYIKYLKKQGLLSDYIFNTWFKDKTDKEFYEFHDELNKM